jgi:hypothetical protein
MGPYQSGSPRTLRHAARGTSPCTHASFSITPRTRWGDRSGHHPRPDIVSTVSCRLPCVDARRETVMRLADMARDVAFPHQHEWLIRSEALCSGGAGLQNGASSRKRLTSRWESPYFSKLVSSFCLVGPHDTIELRVSSMVWELRWIEDEVGATGGQGLNGEGRKTPRPVGMGPVWIMVGRGSAWRPADTTKHVIYEEPDRRNASCQRKGDRPRGGFRLPWARCHADA